MAFRTKLDYSNNRQISQRKETLTELKGATKFGVGIDDLINGPDLNTVVNTEYEIYDGTVVDFTADASGNVFDWVSPISDLPLDVIGHIENQIELLTDVSLEGDGLIVLPITEIPEGVNDWINVFWWGTDPIDVDGENVNTKYMSVGFGINILSIVDSGGGNYSGQIEINEYEIYEAESLDFQGRRIWVDVEGITKTENIIVTNNPTIGYVLTCVDLEGKAEWKPSSGGTSPVWGGINGVLSNQSDLQSALDDKQNLLIAGVGINISGDTISSPNQNLLSVLSTGNVAQDQTIMLNSSTESKYSLLNNDGLFITDGVPIPNNRNSRLRAHGFFTSNSNNDIYLGEIVDSNHGDHHGLHGLKISPNGTLYSGPMIVAEPTLTNSTHTLQNKSGTLAHLQDIHQYVSQVVPFNVTLNMFSNNTQLIIITGSNITLSLQGLTHPLTNAVIIVRGNDGTIVDCASGNNDIIKLDGTETNSETIGNTVAHYFCVDNKYYRIM